MAFSVGELDAQFGEGFEVTRVRERTGVEGAESGVLGQLRDFGVRLGMIAGDQHRRQRLRAGDRLGENLREDRVERFDDPRLREGFLHRFARGRRVPNRQRHEVGREWVGDIDERFPCETADLGGNCRDLGEGHREENDVGRGDRLRVVRDL